VDFQVTNQLLVKYYEFIRYWRKNVSLMEQPYYVGSLSLQHGTSSGCGWRRWPPDMESSCTYTG